MHGVFISRAFKERASALMRKMHASTLPRYHFNIEAMQATLCLSERKKWSDAGAAWDQPVIFTFMA